MQLNRSVCPVLSDQFGLKENGTFGAWIKFFRTALFESKSLRHPLEEYSAVKWQLTDSPQTRASAIGQQKTLQSNNVTKGETKPRDLLKQKTNQCRAHKLETRLNLQTPAL
jgi:hypothetical protein